MTAMIGTSGWQYKDWKGAFYPNEVPRSKWLSVFSQCFATVEVNNTFYRLPEKRTFEKWASATPEDFVITVKANRFLSHIKRLKEPGPVIAKMMAAASGLGEKLGPILVQLPPTMRIDLESLDQTLRAFPQDVRIAVEFRHDSWFVDQTQDLLAEHDAAFVLADRMENRLGPLWRTASWGYMRFHEGTSDLVPCYTEDALMGWAKKLNGMWSSKEDLYIYFNNDPRACAINDAIRFSEILLSMNRETTRASRPGVET